jgi:SAM-dependent methyltransferase
MRRIRRGRQFLEIGPGNLHLAVELLTRFDRGTLIDLNATGVSAMYNALRDADKQRLHLITGDFMESQLTGAEFDCVVACEVLEHVEDDRQFLSRAYSYLKAPGQLMISVPARYKYWSKADEIVGHYRRYEKQDLCRRLSGAGFAEIDVASYGFPFENVVRLGKVFLARIQYEEKSAWDKRRQSEQSAFMLNGGPYLDALGLVVNKYTVYPFCVIASLFNGMDLSDGYVASAFKLP